ncbi:MAG: hypothetical protein HC918_07565 [Oscillatoriales cyanobacterium SM2_1_8]|nr:hypothetical protein [Oscillatoriales cyanobacterium SM2_1_8]
MGLVRYLANLPPGKQILWYYLLWWVSTVCHHFEASWRLWLNSLGISALIGAALILSVGGFATVAKDRWQTFRLFAMPFCVSSFSALTADKGFLLVFPPTLAEWAVSAGLCLAFTVLVLMMRRWAHREIR